MPVVPAKDEKNEELNGVAQVEETTSNESLADTIETTSVANEPEATNGHDVAEEAAVTVEPETAPMRMDSAEAAAPIDQDEVAQAVADDNAAQPLQEDGATVEVEAQPTDVAIDAAASPADDDDMPLMARLLLEIGAGLKTLRRGEVVEGTVMYKDRDELLIDVGAKSEGLVPSKERTTLTVEQLQQLVVGDRVLVYVVRPETEEGDSAILSIDKAEIEKSWRRLQVQLDAGEIVEGMIVGYNSGGLLANLGGVRGFVPTSQVSGLVGLTESARQSAISQLINTTMPLKIIEINRDRNRLILSERLASEGQRQARREKLMAELEEGQIRDGTVTTLTNFGAFVDLGGVDGLVHISELSWNRTSKPSEVLKPGDKVKVYVMSVEPDSRKISLSIKRTQPEPWSEVLEKYRVGQVIEGTITQFAPFGVFARIAEGVEGLIHISELAEGRVENPRTVVKEGEVVTVRIIRIDPQNRRIGLSLRSAQEGAQGSSVSDDDDTGDDDNTDNADTEE